MLSSPENLNEGVGFTVDMAAQKFVVRVTEFTYMGRGLDILVKRKFWSSAGHMYFSFSDSTDQIEIKGLEPLLHYIVKIKLPGDPLLYFEIEAFLPLAGNLGTKKCYIVNNI